MNYRVPKTRKEIFETLIKGLQRLEYRGYDSAGRSLRHPTIAGSLTLVLCGGDIFSLGISLTLLNIPLLI